MMTEFTYVVSFIKDDDRILSKFLRHLIRDFRVEQIMKGIDDNIDKRHLDGVQ